MVSNPSWGPSSALELGVTLERHILERQRSIPEATGEFTGLFQQIALAGKIIASRVNKAGLAGILGVTGERNVQGEVVQKLDVFAHDTIVRCVEAGGYVCMLGSEEEPEPIPIAEPHPRGKYVLMFDPLDGSSNIDVNITVGTIFSIYRRCTQGSSANLKDCLQAGREQVAAGYILYGSSTMFVYTTGDGVYGFTLDPSVGEFFLSHERIRLPERYGSYAINEANAEAWSPGVRAWVQALKSGSANPASDSRGYTQRYVGSMVADLHRILLKGGVFAYPADHRNPQGKLRLLYECSPFSMLAEAAGGKASDGQRRILDIEPDSLHQRVPLIIGSSGEVELALKYLREFPN